MPVSTTESGVLVYGDGATLEFFFNFGVAAGASVKAGLVSPSGIEELPALNYTVTLNIETAGGTVLFGVAPASGQPIYIFRVTPQTQLVGVTSQNKYDPRVVQTVWDKLTYLVQEVNGKVVRALLVPPGTSPETFLADIFEAHEASVLSASSAQAWAESPTAPGDPGTKSSKTWAEEAAALVTDTSVNLRGVEMEATLGALYRSQDHWMAFSRLMGSGALLPVYPAPYSGPVYVRPAPTPLYLANVDVALKRLRQMASVPWTPVLTRSGERGIGQFPVSVGVVGAPYSSVKTVGRAVGWGIQFETFASAVRNPDSIFYQELAPMVGLTPETAPNGFGRVPYGAVCSNFIARAFGWYYPPLTGQLTTQWARFGFIDKRPDGGFYGHDLQRGDVVVTSAGSGHIEIVLEKTETTVTLFDQGYDGPGLTVLSTVPGGPGQSDEATDYIRRRGYAQLIYDYEKLTTTYGAQDYAPLPEETLPAPVFNTVVMLNRGNQSNYNAGETVRCNVVGASAASLVISKDAVIIETIPVTPPQIISRTFADPGDYTAHCVMADTSLSRAEQFKIGSVSASLSASTVTRGADVVITFTTANCTAKTLILERADTYSIGSFLPHEITPDELSAGRIELSTADISARVYNVRVQALNAYGELFNDPSGSLTLTVEN